MPYTAYDRHLSEKYPSLYDDSSPLVWLTSCNEDFSIFLSPQNARRVLDFACGTGAYLRRQIFLGATQTVGVDISPDQVAFSETNTPQSQIILADVRHFTSQSYATHHGKYDVVNASFLYDAADSEADLRSMVEAVASCVRQGGVHTALCVNPDIRRSTDYEWREFGIALLEEWECDRRPKDGEEVVGRFAMSGFTTPNFDANNGTILRGRCFHRSTYCRLLRSVGFSKVDFFHPADWPLNLLHRSKKFHEKFSRYARENPEMIALRAIKAE